MVRLIDKDGTLYTSEADIVDDLCRSHFKGDGTCILISRIEDVNTIQWPNPNERELRSALFDAREMGMIPNVRTVQLPDGSEFSIEPPPAPMKPRNRRETLAMFHIRRKERRIALAMNSLDDPRSVQVIADMQRQIDSTTAKIQSGYFLDDANFELSHDEELEREEARRSYSFQIED